MTFGDRMRQRREALGLTRTALGLMVWPEEPGPRAGYVVHVERNDAAAPWELVRLCVALDCSADWLLGLTDERPPALAPIAVLPVDPEADAAFDRADAARPLRRRATSRPPE